MARAQPLFGRVTLIGLGLLLLLGALSIPSFATFIFEDGRFIPKSYSTLMLASLLSVATGITSIVTFITLVASDARWP